MPVVSFTVDSRMSVIPAVDYLKSLVESTLADMRVPSPPKSCSITRDELAGAGRTKRT